MPPKRLKKKSIKRLVEKHVAKAIEEYEKSRANLDSAGSSGGNPGNAGGTMNVHEKVEQVFETCKCAEEDKVMFAASTFEGRALTWWNGNQELWTLTLKGDDIKAYNNRFYELALMCPELVPTENKKIERYTRGFPERIKGNITSSKPATLHDVIKNLEKIRKISFEAGEEIGGMRVVCGTRGRGLMAFGVGNEIGLEVLGVGWTLGVDGVFSVRELARLVKEKVLRVESGGVEMIWNNLVPKKVNIFVWRALRGRLPVRVELDRREIDLDSVLCPCCNNIVETCSRSLVTCDLAMSV
ncbi:putative reverse transcriptase domain-containing protein [Tanacetum coccineum]